MTNSTQSGFTEDTPIRTNVKTVIAVIVTVAACVYAYADLKRDNADLKRDVASYAQQVTNMQSAMAAEHDLLMDLSREIRINSLSRAALNGK